MKPSVNRTDLQVKMTALVNDTLVVECPVSGVPQPQVVWLRNGEIIDPHRYLHMELRDGGRQLVITGVTVPDAAVYRCLATNPAGQDSQDYQLSVHGIYHIIPYQNGDQADRCHLILW